MSGDGKHGGERSDRRLAVWRRPHTKALFDLKAACLEDGETRMVSLELLRRLVFGARDE